MALKLGRGPEQVAFAYTAGGFWPQLEFPEVTRDCMIVGKLSKLLNKNKGKARASLPYANLKNVKVIAIF